MSRKSSGKPAPEGCPRPYTLGLRAEAMDRNRLRVLASARELLLKRGIADFTIDNIARHARVTRQTIHNQFGTRGALLEAICDQMALRGGMEGIATAFQQADPAATLAEYIKVFARFWSSDREMTRRIHGLAAVDPDFEQLLASRQQRRVMGSSRIVQMLSRRYGTPAQENIEQAIKVLYSLTSFEFFDALAGPGHTPEEVAPMVIQLASSFLGLKANRP
jgi:AcrR family transcriptional regulator